MDERLLTELRLTVDALKGSAELNEIQVKSLKRPVNKLIHHFVETLLGS